MHIEFEKFLVILNLKKKDYAISYKPLIKSKYLVTFDIYIYNCQTNIYLSLTKYLLIFQ